MRIAVVIALLLVLASPRASGAFTDFEDLPRNTNYNVGQVIQSRDIELEVVSFFYLGNPAKTGGGVGPAGIRLAVGPGAEFQLPPGVQEISFDYADGAGLRLAINGVQPAVYPGQGSLPYHAGLSFLNGTSLAGVEVTTTTSTSMPSSEHGFVTLQGPINSFVIAGLELLIDNVSVQIPEPSAAGLLIIGMLVAAFRARYRQSS
jgi:hypothetical protein